MNQDVKKVLIVVMIIGVLAVMSPEGLKLTGGVISKEAYMKEGYGCKVMQYYGPCFEIGEGDWIPHPKNIGWCMQCPFENYKTSE